MYLLYAPEPKFGKIPPKTALITDEVLFTHNFAYCPKHFWKKYHCLQGCLDVSPGPLIRFRERRSLNSILVIATGGIGDSMWAMPFTKALREKYPRSKTIVLCKEASMPVWAHVPYVDLCIKDEFWNMQSLIRNADEVYDFGGIATFMKKEMRLDPVEATFKSGGLPLPKNAKDCRPHIVVTLDEGKQAQAFLKHEGINIDTDEIVAISTESSTSNRNWPFTYIKELTAKLMKGGYKVIWLGTSKEYMTSCLDLETIALGAVNLVGRVSLRQAMAIIALSDVVVGPSSGLLCIATALQIPSVGLFGAFAPTSRDKFYSRFTGLWHKTDCAPCKEHWTECPHGHPAPCMKLLTPDVVHEAILKTLKMWPRSTLEKKPIH